MINSLVMDSAMWKTARHDVTSDVEQARFFLAQPRHGSLRCHAVRVADSAGFDHQSAVHIALSGEFAADLLKWAARDNACLIEMHSHGGDGGVCMSPSDISGLEQWVPQVRWRLGGVPYAAVVQNQGTIDGLVWSEGTQPVALSSIEVVGLTRIATTGLSFDRWYA